MDQTQLISIGIGLAFTALLCVLGVNTALRQRRAFQRELAATRAGQYPPLVAYQRYVQPTNHRAARANNQSATIGLRLVLLFVLVAMSYVGYTALTDPTHLTGFATLIAEDQYLFWFLLPLLLFLPPVVAVLLTSAWADAPAYAQLRGLPTRPSDLVALRAKSFAANLLPVILIIELGAVAYALGVQGVLCFVGALILIVTAILIVSRLGPALLRWYYPSQPIEQTQWAEWGERVHAWAQLADVPISRVYVRATARYGVADGATSGARPQALFLSDVFLQNSDWRQRDALICLLLSLSDRARRAQQRRRQRRQPRGQAAQPGQAGQSAQPDGTIRVNGPLLLVVVLIIAGAAVVSLYGPQIAQATPFPIDPILIINLLPLVLLIVILFVVFRSARRTARQGPAANNVYFESDAIAAALCGDPLALAAAMLGVNLLTGVALDRRYTATLPSALDRVAALQGVMLQPGSYAPWAAQPIPALTPVQMGPYIMSVPISPEAMAERPGPVPSQRYPVTLSPWAATPMLGASPYGAPIPEQPLYDSSQFPQPVAYVPPPGMYQPTPYAAPTAPGQPPTGFVG